MYIDPESGGGENLRNYTIFSYEVMNQDERTFIIIRGELVERVKSDRLDEALTPEKEESNVRNSKIDAKRRKVF